jgi:nickel-dependent lactate racemase
MRVGLDWGSQHLEVEVAAANVIALRRDAPAPPLADVEAAVRHALEAPVDFPPLRRALTPDDHVAIVVDERAPQLSRLLVPILEHIQSAGISPKAITLLCLPPSSGQPWLEALPEAFQEVRVEVHQPRDRRKLSYLATTRQGRRIYLNRSAVDADQLVLLTRRTFDPLLGYAGGVGALFPGLSDEATQRELGAHLHTEAPGRGIRPVQREAAEVAWLLGAPFLVQVIEGTGSDVVHVLAGTAESSAAGEHLLEARWRVTAAQSADLVISGLGGPADLLRADDLARGFFAASRVVRPGGRVVLLTEANPALGPSFDLMRQCEDPAAALPLLLRERPEDLATGFMWTTAAQQAKLYLLSGIPSEVAEELFTIPLEQATEARHLLTGDTTCLLLPDAHKALAVIGGDSRRPA